jgi:simple sugar transport system ATP-binding protein
VVLVNHNLEDVQSMTDRIAVLFQGEVVDVVDTDSVSRDDLVSMMVSGQPLDGPDTDHQLADHPPATDSTDSTDPTDSSTA